MKTTATAFAPATVANVAVGFDILGFALDGPGDEARVTRLPEKGRVEIRAITGPTGMVTRLPSAPEKNTAGQALLKLAADHGVGFAIELKKGIALSSGMGGSAASAVAAVVAANALLDHPLDKAELLRYALEGEAVASGGIHGDNVGPCLFGGLQIALTREDGSIRMVPVPVPRGVYCALIHPEIEIQTREARALLRAEIPLKAHIAQASLLAGFLAGCFRGDLALIRETLHDRLIEPQRSRLIPGFDAMKARALELGALGFSISGAGPSVFAWCEGEAAAKRVAAEATRIFEQQKLKSQAWTLPVSDAGARVIA